MAEALKEGQEKWLFIAWVFGREIPLSALAVELVNQISLDKDGKADSGINNINSLPVPQTLISKPSISYEGVKELENDHLTHLFY